MDPILIFLDGCGRSQWWAQLRVKQSRHIISEGSAAGEGWQQGMTGAAGKAILTIVHEYTYSLVSSQESPQEVSVQASYNLQGWSLGIH
jgi:hypothetical protein